MRLSNDLCVDAHAFYTCEFPWWVATGARLSCEVGDPFEVRCYRSHRSLPVQGQILEDLSLDADALCMLRFSPRLARVAPTNTTSSGDVLELGCSSLPNQTDAAIASSEVETLAVAQLRGLECHAKQVSCCPFVDRDWKV